MKICQRPLPLLFAALCGVCHPSHSSHAAAEAFGLGTPTPLRDIRTGTHNERQIHSDGAALRIPRGGGAADPTAAAAASALEAVPAWVSLCSRMAPVASVALSLSPLPTIRRILKDGSVGDLPLLPYSSMVANVFVWTLYGVLRRDPTLWSCNGVGVVLGLYYFASFVRYSPKAAPTLPGSVSQHVRASAGILAAASAIALALPAKRAAPILGKMGVVICIGLFVSPLVALKTVFETKSAESIPLPFALVTTFNCFVWSVYAILDVKDVNVMIPNVLGLSAGIAQIVLKLVYGDGKRREGKAAA